jgi:prolyl-tRNA synthetase
MQDAKALQCGTSHNLGQNFAKAFEIKFLGRNQQQEFAWTTSWGMTTRMIGAMVMVHSDDEGLIIPPRAAPNVLAVVPIFKGDPEKVKVKEFIGKLITALVGENEVAASAARQSGNEIETYFFDPITHQRILVDWRDARPGDKQYHWEQRGVPFRIEVGPRDVDGGCFVLKRRLDRGKESVPLATANPQWLRTKLDEVQSAMLEKARKFTQDNTRRAGSYDELKKILEEKGGFVRGWFKPDRDAEAKIKAETKATVRCIPFDQPGGKGQCIYSGQETDVEVIFAQAY